MKHAMTDRVRRAAGNRIVVLVVVALSVPLLTAGFLNRTGSTSLTAYVRSASGIYAGDEVRVLGVIVGKIDDITPERDQVRIDFHVDGDVKLPADAKAAIVAPSLVSSRYLQVAPRYEGGPQLEDGGVIPVERTATPVEWDEIKGQLNDLAVALGPGGANKRGALSRLVSSAAGALDGQGASINETIANLAGAVRTLESGSGDMFSTVRNLQVFVSALAASDTQIAEFSERLDAVSGMLADNKQSVRTALHELAGTVGKVERFVRTNRGSLRKTLVGLTDVASVVAKHQESLAQTLHVAPNALGNLVESYHQRQNAVAVDLHAANVNSPGQLACGALGGAAGVSGPAAEKLCQGVLGDLLDKLASSGVAQNLIDTIKTLLGLM
ncbi:MAG TPA: MCE family protein [Nocardioidaceae bacterium]|nr:MCE family protein [Nocardioidaceae bacterium]